MLISQPSSTPLCLSQRGLPRRASAAFTLVELLVVMGVIVILIGIVTPVVTSMKNSGDVNKAVYDIAGIIEQSRTFAMSNNTYVYVGIGEFDVSVSNETTPQKSGTGRIGLAVVATKDGTQGFSNSSLLNSTGWSTIYPTFASNLSVIGKPLVFDNLHLPADLGKMPTSGGMVRPVLSDPIYSLGNTDDTSKSATPFDYPLNSNNLGSGKYSFKKVIQFDPQGVARLQTTANPTSIVPYMEIDLQQSHGTAVTATPPPGTGNVVALQIDGMTGTVHIYRP